MRPFSIGTATLLTVVAALSRPAAAETTLCTQITKVPWTISAPGVYCLNSDFTVAWSSGAAIQINASNVTLDLNRHVLNNLPLPTSTYAYGITATQQRNVVIKNGSVRGFFVGVALFDASPYTTTQDNVIEDISAAGTAWTAIYVEGQGNLVLHNRVMQTGGPTGAIGIFVAGPNNVIRNNEVLATTTTPGDAFAIYGWAAVGLIAEDNRISGVVSPQSFGVYLYSLSHAVIRNNTVDRADTADGGYASSYGIYFDSSNDNTVVANQVVAFNYGIYAPTGSSAQTSGNIVIGGSVPVTGTTAATLY